MERKLHTLPHLIGYHGCDKAVGEKVLAGKVGLTQSNEKHDWLGHGIYFWLDSPDRAWRWAQQRNAQGKIKTPFVLGAMIYPGLCLNLLDVGVIEELREAYKVLKAGTPPDEMPQNRAHKNGTPLARNLDCAVFNTLHALRTDDGKPDYQTVMGVFDEGDFAYPGAGFKELTHIQVAVRDVSTIIAYFRVDTRQFA